VDFFDRLAAEPPPVLRKMTATVRFDLDVPGPQGPTTRHWLVTMDHGTVRVAHRKGRADAVIHVDRDLFERILAGEANAMAATLRGQISLEGDRELLVAFQRLTPGPSKGD
jgi:hypothetical protein